MARKVYEDPGPRPKGATPKEIEKWRRDQEAFLTEGGRHLPTERPKIDATDERLKELRRDHKAFMSKMKPATDALWLALLKRPQDVLADVAAFEKLDRANRLGLREEIDTPDIPSIVLLAERQVAAGLRGEMPALAAIWERIEGKTGLRQGDADPDDPEQLRKQRAVVEDTIRLITEKGLEAKLCEAEDADFVDITPPAKETDAS